MIFHSNQPIFVQIAEYIHERILKKELIADQQIPSVRELAVSLEVNPNTVMRSFERLQQGGFIYNKRGLGYFVASDAYSKILQLRKRRLFEEVLPSIYDEMRLLNISEEEFLNHYRQDTAHN